MKSQFLSGIEVARVTVLNALRSRLLLISVAFSVLLVALSVGAATVSFGERARLIFDVGTAASSIVGSIVTIALTISSIAADLQSRAAYTVLVRPVSRPTFVFGKFLGIFLAVVAVTTIMQIATAVTVIAFGESIPGAFWIGIWMTWVEMAVVAATSMLFSTISSPVVASTLAAGTLVVGHLSQDALDIARRSEEMAASMRFLLETTFYIAPDIQSISVRSLIANALEVPPNVVLAGTAYGIAYAAAALCLAMIAFSRRRAL